MEALFYLLVITMATPYWFIKGFIQGIREAIQEWRMERLEAQLREIDKIEFAQLREASKNGTLELIDMENCEKAWSNECTRECPCFDVCEHW